jgi:hypothetical protein
MRKFSAIIGFLLLFIGGFTHLYAQTAKQELKPTVTTTAKSNAGFPAQIQIGNTNLNLNGKGTRYKAIFKIYDMALYTPSKVSTVEQAIALNGPVRLQFVALRDLPTGDIGLMFYRGIRDNVSPELYRKHTSSASRLSEMSSIRSKILQGESFAIEYVPNKGLTFIIDDKPQSAPFGDAEFFGMVLRIWLGQVPADYLLKDALLGVSKTS